MAEESTKIKENGNKVKDIYLGVIFCELARGLKFDNIRTFLPRTVPGTWGTASGMSGVFNA